MDLKDLKPEGRDIEILHPGTEEKLNIKVSVLSINDPAMQKIKRKIQDERLGLERKGKGFKSDEIERNRDVLTLNAMTGWKWGGDAKFNGEVPKFNRKNVLAVFAELPWFRDQVEEAISDESAFFTTSK